MQAAHQLISEGSWAGGAAALEQAAAIHKLAGRSLARRDVCNWRLQVRRSAGDPARARELADRAAAVADASQSTSPADLPLAVSIAVEQAQTAFDEGANRGLRDGMESRDRSCSRRQSEPESLSALLRSGPPRKSASGAIDQASNDFNEAYDLLKGSDARFVRVEHAAMLAQHGRADQANQILDSIEAITDAHLRAETLVQRSKLSRQAGKFDESIRQANAARDAALEAVAPVSYFAAAGELAQSMDANGDYAGSYGALATAWATLGDLLGDGVARSWVQPVLTAYKFKWG